MTSVGAGGALPLAAERVSEDSGQLETRFQWQDRLTGRTMWTYWAGLLVVNLPQKFLYDPNPGDVCSCKGIVVFGR